MRAEVNKKTSAFLARRNATVYNYRMVLQSPRRLALVLALFSMTAMPAAALYAQSTQDELRTRLLGKHLFLRGQWGSEELSFDGFGKPSKPYSIIPFSEAAIDVSSVKLNNGVLKIEGERMGLEFDRNGKVRWVRLQTRHNSGSIAIEITGAPVDYGPALGAIFAFDLADLTPSLPQYWQTYARSHFCAVPVADQTGAKGTCAAASSSSQSQAALADNQALHPDPAPAQAEKKLANAGGKVTPPKLIKSADPSPTDIALALHYSASVEVYFWLHEDGTLSHLRVVRPAGLGLDESALATVAQYIFQPATRNGKPVKVDLYVEVSYDTQ